MRNKIIIILCLSISVFAKDHTFTGTPTSIYKENKEMRITFKVRAAIYKLSANSKCLNVINENEDKELLIVFDPKTLIIKSCTNI